MIYELPQDPHKVFRIFDIDNEEQVVSVERLGDIETEDNQEEEDDSE